MCGIPLYCHLVYKLITTFDVHLRLYTRVHEVGIVYISWIIFIWSRSSKKHHNHHHCCCHQHDFHHHHFHEIGSQLVIFDKFMVYFGPKKYVPENVLLLLDRKGCMLTGHGVCLSSIYYILLPTLPHPPHCFRTPPPLPLLKSQGNSPSLRNL